MRTGETRKYVVPMKGLGLTGFRPAVTEEEKARGNWVLQTKPANPRLIGVTFTPAPEFITPALSPEETERLLAATRQD